MDEHDGRVAGEVPSTGHRAAVWAFDVDGTLIGSVRSDRLRPGAVALLDALLARGVNPVLWSAGGASYAEQMARLHGIESRFVAFYGKELRGPDGRYVTDHFDADHLPHVFVDDVPIDLPRQARVVAVAQFLGGNDSDGVLTALTTGLDEWFVR